MQSTCHHLNIERACVNIPYWLLFARPSFSRPLWQKCKFGAMVNEQIKLMLMIFWLRALILFHDKMIVQWSTESSASVLPKNDHFYSNSASVRKMIPRFASASVKIELPFAFLGLGKIWRFKGAGGSEGSQVDFQF